MPYRDEVAGDSGTIRPDNVATTCAVAPALPAAGDVAAEAVAAGDFPAASLAADGFAADVVGTGQLGGAEVVIAGVPRGDGVAVGHGMQVPEVDGTGTLIPTALLVDFAVVVVRADVVGAVARADVDDEADDVSVLRDVGPDRGAAVDACDACDTRDCCDACDNRDPCDTPVVVGVAGGVVQVGAGEPSRRARR